MNILCIDDDEGLLYLFRHTLEEISYQVTTCRDSEDVIPLLRTNHFDAVTLDQEMPRLNGLELLKQVREFEHIPPIIMVTGAGNEETAVAAMRHGASDY